MWHTSSHGRLTFKVLAVSLVTLNLVIYYLDIEFSVALWLSSGVRNPKVWGNLVLRSYLLTVNEMYLQPLDPGRSGYEIRSGVQFLEGIQIFSLSHNCDETKEPFLFQLPSPNLPFYLFKREDL